jgi:hypothetical protein
MGGASPEEMAAGAPLNPPKTPTAPTTTTTAPPTAPPTATQQQPTQPPDPDKISAATNAAPKLEPDAVVGVAATSSSAQEAAVKAQAINVYNQSVKMADLLKKQSVDWQHSYWEKASNTTQSLLAAAGYEPPNPADVTTQNPGFWHGIVHIADDVRHGAAATSNAAVAPLGQVFNTAMSPISQLERSAFLSAGQQHVKLGEEGKTNSLSADWNTLTGVLRDYNSVSNGATSFQPDVVIYVKKIMGINGQTLKLAKLMAGGDNLQEVLASMPPDVRANAFSLIQTNPKFMDAVKMLSDGHLSLGQVLFGGLSAPQAHQVFPKVSEGDIQKLTTGGQVVGAAGVAAGIAAGGEEGLPSQIGDLLSGGGASLRGTIALGTLGGSVSASVLAASKGESVDTETAIQPFGLTVHPLSGLADGLVGWYGNPLFGLLQGRSAYNDAVHSLATMDAMKDANVVRFYTTRGSGIRFARVFAKAATSPWIDKATGEAGKTANFQAIVNAGIKVDGMEDVINGSYDAIKAAQEAGHPEQAVGEMMAKPQAMMNIFRGRAGMFYRDATQYPHITITEQMAEDLKGIGKRALGGRRFNPGAVSPRDLITDAFGSTVADDGIAAAQAEEKEQALGPAARFTRRTTNLVPTNGYVKFSDRDIGTQIERLAAFSLPDDMIASARNGFSAIPKGAIGEQRKFITGVVGDMMQWMGIDRTADGKAFMDGWLDKQRYSYQGNADWVNSADPDGPKTAMALWDTQLADAIGLPDFRELYKYAKKSWFMSLLQSGLNNDLFDKFMSSFWKRALLLRPGFALRFAGEEALNYMLRNGPRAYLEGRVASSLYNTANVSAERRAVADAAAAAAARGDVGAVNDADAGALHHALTSGLPPEVVANIKTPNELRASLSAFNAMDWLRGGGIAFTPNDILDGAMNLAKRGVLDSPYEDAISVVSAHGDVYTGDTKLDEQSLWKNENGDDVSISRTGIYRAVKPGSNEEIPGWSMKLSQIARSQVGKIAARAWQHGGVDAQIQEVEDWINGTAIKTRVADREADLEDARLEGSDSDIKRAQQSLDGVKKEFEYHEQQLQRFGVYGQSKDGSTVASGAITQEQANHDWAEAMVNDLNHYTMTTEPQDFTEVDGEMVPNPTDGPQPIRLPVSLTPKTPWKIGTRDEDRNISIADPKGPYTGVPAGHVRLFHAENTKTAQEGLPRITNPGRAWFPDFQKAMNRAGSDGEVYQIDVPADVAKEHYDYHGTGDVDEHLTNIQEAQGAGKRGGGKEPNIPGHFESGDVVHSREGENTPRLLIDEIGRGEVPGNDTLKRIDRIHIPDDIAAPDMVLKVDKENLYERFMNKGMQQVVGRPADWLSRQPIFTRNYSIALKEARTFVSARQIEDESGDLAHDIAMERATNETLPYIHNPAVKSQMSVIVRNMAPFWFAQEQFYKRWARLFGTYPEAWYKLQLTMNGMRSVGFVQNDQYGQASFVYPGSQAVLKFLTQLPFFGSIPVGVALTGEVSQLNPTLANSLAPWPSFGPIVTVPMSLVGVMFQHWGITQPMDVAQATLGPEAPQIEQDDNWIQDIVGQLMPSFVNRTFQWTLADIDGNPGNVSAPIYMSAMITAAQQMEAQGHGLTGEEQRNPRLVQQYLDRLANWTKNIILLRAFFGLMAPATPTFKFNDQGLGAKLDALINTMPYDQAVSEFLKVYPNATPDTIFGSSTSNSSSLSGAYVPATTLAANFINKNVDFFENYPQIAPWALPNESSRALFNANAYAEEETLDLRVKSNLTQWYDATKYAEGANIYYPLEQTVEAAKSGTTATALSAQQALGITQAQAQQRLGVEGQSEQQISATWDAWKTKFLYTHPIFNNQLSVEGTMGDARRNNVVQDLQSAIKADALPETNWSSKVQILMAAYDKVADAYPSLEGTTQATQNKDAFIVWANAYAAAYPVVAPFVNGVLIKQVPG